MIKVFVDEHELDASQYTVEGDTLTLHASAFPAVGGGWTNICCRIRVVFDDLTLLRTS